MPGGSSTNQNQTQTTVSNPWEPAQPLLQGILGKLGGIDTSVTGAQSEALANLQQSAAGIPNYTKGVSGVADELLGSTSQYGGMLTDALKSYQSGAAPYLDPSYLDPTTNPGLRSALDTVRNDVSNSVNSQFAAAGRDLSPANTQALARGISQGEAGILTDQFNKNVATQTGMLGNLFGASGSTASGLSSLDQTALGNKLQGVNVAGMLPQIALGPASAQYSAANQAYQQPFSNLGMLSSMVSPIAALGGQSSGTTTGTTTKQTDPLSNILGLATGGLGLIGGTGGFGQNGWLSSMFR